MNHANMIFGSTQAPEAPTSARGNEGWSRKINTIEVIDNRIYFYAEIYREDILSLNRQLRELRSSLIRDRLTREINDVKIFYTSKVTAETSLPACRQWMKYSRWEKKFQL